MADNIEWRSLDVLGAEGMSLRVGSFRSADGEVVEFTPDIIRKVFSKVTHAVPMYLTHRGAESGQPRQILGHAVKLGLETTGDQLHYKAVMTDPQFKMLYASGFDDTSAEVEPIRDKAGHIVDGKLTGIAVVPNPAIVGTEMKVTQLAFEKREEGHLKHDVSGRTLPNNAPSGDDGSTSAANKKTLPGNDYPLATATYPHAVPGYPQAADVTQVDFPEPRDAAWPEANPSGVPPMAWPRVAILSDGNDGGFEMATKGLDKTLLEAGVAPEKVEPLVAGLRTYFSRELKFEDMEKKAEDAEKKFSDQSVALDNLQKQFEAVSGELNAIYTGQVSGLIADVKGLKFEAPEALIEGQSPAQAIKTLSTLKVNLSKMTPAQLAAIPPTAPVGGPSAAPMGVPAVPPAKFNAAQETDNRINELGVADMWNRLHANRGGSNQQFPVNTVHPLNATTNTPGVM